MTFYVLINVFVFTALSLWLYQKTRYEPLKPFFFITLFLKLGAGFVLGWIYLEFLNGGDTFAYHNASLVLTKFVREDPSSFLRFLLFNNPIPDDYSAYLDQPRALLFVKIISLFGIFTNDNYWLIATYFSLFSFMGVWLLANRISSLFPDYRLAALISFLFFPSVVFWSSGLLKESLAMGCIGLYLYIFLPFYMKLKINVIQLIVIIFSSVLLWFLKYYYAGVLFSVTLALLLTKIVITNPRFAFNEIKPASRIFLFILVILGIGISFFHPNLNPANIYGILEENHFHMIEISEPANLIRFINYGDGSIYFLINLPISLIGGLFLPLPWSSGNFLAIMTGFFNLLILITALSKILYLRRIEDPDVRLLSTGTIVYILILSTLLAFSTPNFGTLERFKVSYLPFFLLVIIHGNVLIRKIFLNQRE